MLPPPAQLVGFGGNKLECSHYTPAVWIEEALPCVIYLHGNSGCRVDAYDTVRSLLPLNVTVFALDLSGSGLSEGEYITLGVRESEDLRCVVAHLRSTGRVTKIGLWGRSMGAATSLFYGAKDPSVAALVLDSPFSNLTALMMELADDIGKTKGVPMPRVLLKAAVSLMRRSILRRAHFDIQHLDVLAAAGGSFVPALFGHGTEDTFIKPHHTEALYDVYPGDKNFVRFKGGHNSARPAFFFDSVCIFFLNTLHPPQTPPEQADAAAGAALSPPCSPVLQAPFRPAEIPPPPLLPAGPPTSDELQSLLRMGFPRTVAEGALRRFRSLQLAAEWLVDNAGDGWAGLAVGPAVQGVVIESPPMPAAAAASGGAAFGDADEWSPLEPPAEDDVRLTEEEDTLLARALGLSLSELYPGEERSPRSAEAAAAAGEQR